MGKKFNASRPPNESNERWETMNKGMKTHTWAQWNVGRANRNLPRVDPPPGSQIAVTHRPPGGGSNASISFRDFKHGVGATTVGSPVNTTFPSTTSTGGPPPARSPPDTPRKTARKFDEGIDAAIESIFQETATTAPRKRNRADEVGDDSPAKRPTHDASSSQVAGTSGVQPPQVTAPPTTQDVVMATPAAAGGGSAVSDGGFDSTSGPETIIPSQGYSQSSGTMSFTKVHHLKSWAIPFKVFIVGTNKHTLTPLMYVPWDQMFMYMSEDEFKLIPRPAKVVRCKMSIQHLTSAVQFETAAMNTNIAATGHAKIMITGSNLLSKVVGGQTLHTTFTNPNNIIPDGVEPYNPTKYINTLYGNRQSDADWDTSLPAINYGIPLYPNDYFAVTEPTKAQAAVDGLTALNAPGSTLFMKHVTQTNMNDSTWTSIVNMDYTFSNATIGTTYPVLEPLTQNRVNANGNGLMHVPTSRVYGGLPSSADTTLAQNELPMSRAAHSEVLYTGVIEQGANVVKGTNVTRPAVQPTYHCGMRAIDKNGPSEIALADSFVTASAYWVVTCHMEISLPHYPMGRFLRPTIFSVNIENANLGVAAYPTFNGLRTHGLPQTTATKPTAMVLRNRNKRTLPKSTLERMTSN